MARAAHPQFQGKDHVAWGHTAGVRFSCRLCPPRGGAALGELGGGCESEGIALRLRGDPSGEGAGVPRRGDPASCPPRAPVLVALALIESGMKYEDAIQFIRQ